MEQDLTYIEQQRLIDLAEWRVTVEFSAIGPYDAETAEYLADEWRSSFAEDASAEYMDDDEYMVYGWMVIPDIRAMDEDALYEKIRNNVRDYIPKDKLELAEGMGFGNPFPNGAVCVENGNWVDF
jgi:hypothetical protein